MSASTPSTSASTSPSTSTSASASTPVSTSASAASPFIYIEEFEGLIWVNYEGWTYTLPSEGVHRLKKKSTQTNLSDGDLVSPMPGQVLKLNVKKGDSVKEGQTVCVVEAMKMEHSLKSPFAGQVHQINCKEGQAVSLGDLLLSIKSEDKRQKK